ncbi:hypothetical protein DLM75_21785 [Leptospira stimsonii]|uniref:Uncharacterized protein n=1 Tax=Leptospira stimsonii TaxID=2202203 RepID=A0A396YPK3_9LEPT|nr:hypothetical protein DLM75_21785 [Leptospira stimsonii]
MKKKGGDSPPFLFLHPIFSYQCWIKMILGLIKGRKISTTQTFSIYLTYGVCRPFPLSPK